MKKDEEKRTTLKLVPNTADGDLMREAAIAVRAGKERLASDEVAGRREKNSKQFLRMEEPVRHATFRAQIVEDLIIQAEEDGCVELDEHLVWGVLHLGDMVKKLRPFYRFEPAEEQDDDGAA
jgi:hypothetical protein